jgi:hypothetical protein
VPTSTPQADQADRTILTVPFTLKDAKPRTSHFHEVKATGGKTYAGAILVLANSIVEALGADAPKDLTITITAGKVEPTVLLPEPVTPAPAPEPTKAEADAVKTEGDAAAEANGAEGDEPKADDKAKDDKAAAKK